VKLSTGSGDRNPLPAVRHRNRSAAWQRATIDDNPCSSKSAVSAGREGLTSNRVI